MQGAAREQEWAAGGGARARATQRVIWSSSGGRWLGVMARGLGKHVRRQRTDARSRERCAQGLIGCPEEVRDACRHEVGRGAESRALVSDLLIQRPRAAEELLKAARHWSACVTVIVRAKQT